MRVCSQCGAQDREIAVPEGVGVHWVVPELRWLATGSTCGKRETELGWRPRIVQGREGMERMSCRDCLNRNAVRDQIWGAMKADAFDLERPVADTYYLNLCEG